MQSPYRTISYEITTDPEFLNNLYHISPEIQGLMPELQEKATKGKTTAIRKFQKLIQKNPKNPQLKNLLSSLYANSGNQQKAIELNKWIVAEHPEYLFGKLNLAAGYYHSNDLEAMREIMGGTMELQELYPERATFYIGEVISFYKLAVMYFTRIGDYEQAKLRLEVMQDVGPEFPDTEYAEDVLSTSLMMERFGSEPDEQVKPEVPPKPLPPQHRKPPSLKHPEVERLYSTSWNISNEDIESILQLPRESLIADLEALLVDALERFEYFESGEGDPELDSNFAIHSILILGEIEAEESLPAILDFLTHEEDVLDFWLGDTLTEIVWQSLYKAGQNQPEALRDFLLDPRPELFSKTSASVALSQLAHLQPQRREEVLQHYRIFLERVAKASADDNIIDSEINGFVIGDLIDINAIELLPEIKKLYDLKYVDIFGCGDYEDVEKDIQHGKTLQMTLYSLKKQYEWLNGFKASREQDADTDEADYLFPEPFSRQPVVKPKKVGRNDPCPCGSGKKYKKCCG